ncbi:flagellar M-ring protein FliF [Marinobacter sp. M3C]|jgi:flagellar M-ring protein FliF|uniref:flagellar basal-body MS-ring/collar protein FliF n=1 Tax=unclassified Marinobacter TaxID=83889 RepID=UPI00200CA26B|nr:MULTISPECIES: flagellar basal-body MS-ring/collar protein FliF [unclassified Marinobacter]MCL1479140.1 flagellar M-ring protein FliF [Marinobacter sp.]MCL1485067.1 flagellar M-ring protein FliF [Marinobacter sp.]MCL1488894.1 flagellar M-ring protein FliF [Marinobacter sp.]UQG57211.1 flagellar M-ring protein FliF [Marinobacter sp. M4C]UQG61606.1 flagellar M-ring protein FliF [Marinobacter sp. M3C]
MASVPAQTTQSNLPATSAADSTGEGRSRAFMGFNRLDLLRQIGLMVGLAASVALGVAVVLWAQEPNYQPVLGDLSSYNPQDVTRILDTNGIDYKMDPRTGALLVVADQVYNARLRLAAEGVTDQKTLGFELLDQDRGLGTSQYMETISYRRGLEGELARTIASMRGIRSARVHLAIPERSVFIRDAREPSASVFLEVFAGRRPEQEHIAAIVNLVAGSVPMMTKSGVTVVDQNGNLLTGSDAKTDTDRMSDQYDFTDRVEERLSHRVSSLISPIVGEGRYRTEVSADLDFSSVEQAEELFNPEQQAVRSERKLTESRGAGGAPIGIPGALSNQPPANATVPQQANAAGAEPAPAPVDVRSESTRNYEIDRTVSYVRQELGRIKRLTVALAVDDMKVVNADTGAVTYEPWPEQELQRLSMLVRDAVGYSAARGDSVTVMNTAFAPEQVVAYDAPGFWTQPWFWDLMKQVLAGLVVLVLVLGLLRPTLKNLSNGNKGLAGGDNEGYGDLDGIEGGDSLRQAMANQDDLLLPGSTGGYDRQLNALKGLIAEDPARVAQVMRQWVNVDD